MKIAIATTQVPFVYGGAEFLADDLREKLCEYGHQSQIYKLPFKWYPPQRILEHMLAARLIKLINTDLVIALKFPVYYLEHDNKKLWLLHQFRQAYDLWGTPFQMLPDSPEGTETRNAIIRADNRYLRAVKKIYTNSSVVSGRLQKFNGISSTVLFPPLKRPEIFRCDSYGDYVFYPSRITGGKRQHLLIEALRYTGPEVRAIIAGSPETKSDLDVLTAAIKEHKLEGRVELIPRFISQEEKVTLYANCLGCVYIPYDEDSYGYVTLESYCSRKPVITCTDSGGTLDMVRDGITGLVRPPDPHAIAEGIDALAGDRALCERLGTTGYNSLREKQISWETVVRSLTA